MVNFGQIQSTENIYLGLELGRGSVVECLPTMYKVLGPISGHCQEEKKMKHILSNNQAL